MKMDAAVDFLKALAKIRTPFLDVLIQLLTRFGEELIIFGVICVFYWCLNKDVAYKLGFAFFASGIAVQGLKVTCRIERPWVIDPSFKPVGTAIKEATGYSFPSGHTQSATALYGTGAFITKRVWLKAMFVLLALGVGFSRMYLGVHTYFDVSVALIITFLVAFLVCHFYSVITREGNELAVSIVLAVLSVFLAAYSLILAECGHVAWGQIDGCFKTGGAGLGFAVGYYLERKYIRFNPREGKLVFQVIKLIVGIAGALFFKSVLKLIAPESLILDFIRYFLTILWVMAAFPWLFTKLIAKINAKNGSNFKNC